MPRCIDADLLMEKIRKCKIEVTNCGILYHAGDVQSIINNMPTVVPTDREIAVKIFDDINTCCITKVVNRGEVIWDLSEKFANVKKKYIGE